MDWYPRGGAPHFPRCEGLSQTVGRPRSSSLSRGLLMAKLTLSEAARACGVARTTIQRAVKTGRLSLDAEHQVDTAELLRVGFQVDAAVLHAASQQPGTATPQNAAGAHSTPQRSDGAAPDL